MTISTQPPSDLLNTFSVKYGSVLFTKTASRGTSYKDDSEDRGDKRRRERVLTFQCRATKRPGAIPLEVKASPSSPASE